MSCSPEDTVRVAVNGKQVDVPAGRSAAGALMLVAGQSSWRVTRREEAPRGLFCGIGSCFDCLVTVDGEDQQRACLVPVAEGMHIDTEGNTASE